MPFPWAALAVLFASQVLQVLLRPKPRVRNAQPAADGTWNVLTAEEGRPIPVPRGRVLQKAANCVWWGDTHTEPINQLVQKPTWLSHSVYQTAGHKYFLGAHLVLGWGPIDAIHAIWINGKPVPGANIVVTAANDGIVYSLYPYTGDYDVTAHLAHGTYQTIADFCAAVEAIWRPTYAIRVCYGYTVLAGWCDVLQYTVTDGNGTRTTSLTLDPGKYSGAGLASELERAFAEAEALQDLDDRVWVRVRWVPDAGGHWANTGRFQFTIERALGGGGEDVTHFGFYHGNQGYPENCGYMLGMDVNNSWAGGDPADRLEYETEYPTAGDRFNFGVPALGLFLKLADPAFTAKALLGLDATLIRERPDSPGNYYAAGVCPACHTLSDYPIRILRDAPYIFDRDDHFEIVIQADDLFGGDTGNGGFAGTIDVYKGTLTQGRSEYLRLHEHDPIGAYHGLCYAVLKSCYIGNSPYLPELAFELSARPNVLALPGGQQDLDDDVNPANLVHEVWTDPRWGLGVSPSLIDLVAAIAAGATLADEDMGLSMILDRGGAASGLFEEILRYLDGMISIEPTTGQLTLRLTRADYVAEELPLLDESNLDDCEITWPLWPETSNVVHVTFTDRANFYATRIATERELANILARGGECATEEVPFLGISKAARAQRTAARVLRAVAYPYAAIRLAPNRQAWALRPGDRFRLNWARAQVTGMIGIVSGGSGGTLEDGRIRMTALQDVFSVYSAALPAPGPSGWVDPGVPPSPSIARRLEELWYALLGTTDRGVAALCVRGSAPMQGFEVWSDPTGGQSLTLTNTVHRATPYGTLVAALAVTESVELVIENAVDCLGLVSGAWGDHLLLIGDELIAWLAPTVNPDGTVRLSGLARGVCDTAPRAHALGAPVFLVTDGYGLTDPEPYTADVTLTARLAPFNGGGKLSPSAEPELSLTTTSRATRPYCPTDLLVNAEAYPATAARPVVLTWEHRDRDAAWDYADSGLVDDVAAGVQYRVKAYNAYDVVVDEQTTTGKTVTLNYSASIDVVAVRVYAEIVSGGLLSHDYLLWEGVVT